MTSLGNTGAMMPSASMSKSTVPKMNQNVARRMRGGARLEPPDQSGDGGAATRLQVPLDTRAQRLRLHVGMVVVHEVEHGAEHAIRALLVISTEVAGRYRGSHLIAADGRCVAPQALVAIIPKRHSHAGAQREYLGEIALHHAVMVSGAAGVVAMTKRRGDVAVLGHRRLADGVRDRMAQPLHLGIGAVSRLQLGEGFGHALPGDNRAVALLMTAQRDVRVAGTTDHRRTSRCREYTRAQDGDSRHGDREHADGDYSRPAGQLHATHHNTGGGPGGSAYLSHMNRLTGPALLAALGALGCATNPATGARQFMLVSESQEIAMGRDYDKQVVASIGLYADSALQRYIQQFGMRLAATSERPNLPWTFHVVDDPVVNAFALPGGFIYVTRGILAHLNSEAGLAGVVGHEIGHVTARHSASQMTKQQLAQVGLVVGSIASSEFGRYAGLASQALGVLFLKYSRDNERQADDLGLRYMRRVNYDPREMPHVFEMLTRVSQTQGGGRVPEWLAPHPRPQNRGARTRQQR